MKKLVAILLACVMALSMAACTNNNGSQYLPICIASEPDSLDPALNSAVDGATMIAHLFSGLAKWGQKADGTLEIVPDMAEELVKPVKNDDGTVTYTYKIRKDAKWSDGKAVTANDFVFAWNRAASYDLAADYCYMFEVVDGYAKMWEDEDSGEVDKDGNPIYKAVYPDAKLNIKAVDDNTFEVVVLGDLPYWNELLAFPTFFPVREDIVDAEGKWATDPKTYVCNGMYMMEAWEHHSVITLKKNTNHPDAAKCTMPGIKFYLSDDANNMLANFKNGEWLLIDDVPTNEIESLKTNYPKEFVVDGQIGTYYVCWNINEDILPNGTEAQKAEIRNAISLLFDRNYVCEAIAQGGQVPASSFVAMGITEPKGTQFYKAVGKSDKFDGYYDVSKEAMESNFASAIETLKKYYTWNEADKKFTDFPTMTYLYNTNEGHKAIGEYLQSALAAVGINMELQNQDWATFLNTRKNGDYSIARNGWVADYNDGICFLDMWTTTSGNNDVQYGKGAHKDVAIYSVDLTDLGIDLKVENGTWAETYDQLIYYAKTTTDDLEKRNTIMHRAEDLLMSTGCICPLYFYTDLYMISEKVKGFYSNPLGYKYFMYTTIAK